MKHKVLDKYICGICGARYESVQERANCELKCVKKIEEEERKAAEAKRIEEQADRKFEVDNAYKTFTELAKKYAEDYGSYEYEGETLASALWPSRLWHHFWF